MRVLWSESSLSRVRSCSRHRVTADVGVMVRLRDGVAHYDNVQRCASVHACPLCAPKIRQERANEIVRGLRVHVQRDGGWAYLLTMTVPHDQGDDLGRLLDAVADSWTFCLRGAAWAGSKRGVGVKERYGIVGTIMSKDFTFGVNGWHPHLHNIVLTDRVLTDEEVVGLGGYFAAKWAVRAQYHGLRCPSDAHGVTFEPMRSLDDAARYVAKEDAFSLAPAADAGDEGAALEDAAFPLAMEVARQDLKRGRGGRTPFELLQSVVDDGDADDLRRWRQYERATKGRRAINWSRGLKARLLVEEATDDELAELEVGGELVVEIRSDRWCEMLRRPGALAMVLEAAERGGAQAVEAAMGELFGWLHDEMSWLGYVANEDEASWLLRHHGLAS